MLSLSLLFLAGCMVGPNYHRPEVHVPENWAGPTLAGEQAVQPSQNALAYWWRVFEDPMLSSLEERALESNLDLKLAGARIRQARAAKKGAQSALGPSADATASYQRSQSSGLRTDGLAIEGDREGLRSDQYQAGFDAAWEADIFGGARRGIEAADSDLSAAVEARQDVLVTLAAEVARNYVELRGLQQRIAIAGHNLKAQKHTAGLTRQRFEGGFASGLDVANAEAQVATTASEIPLLEASARQVIYAISVLLGENPPALVRELSPVSEIPAAPPSVPLGVPSALLLRRPDIRLAEAQVHAATARIGVATADLFPRFTISGTIGVQASDPGSWFRFWGLGPSVSWRVFDSGRIRSNIEQQEALREQSLFTYQQTVLIALQEVENALIASAKEEERRKALLQAVAYNRKAVQLATQLYIEGQTDFLNVLQAQRALFASEDALIQSNRTLSTNLIALYKALGGGWEEDSPDNL
jgi:NodT family efflux transporter outer membrane factor (OMF) lipoprotein